MSRSRKSVAVWKDNDGPGKKKYWKRQAAKRVRRYKHLLQGGTSRKCFESWIICDDSFTADDDDPRRYQALMK